MLTTAAVEIVILRVMMILALVVLFWKCDRVAGSLLLPYLLSVTA